MKNLWFLCHLVLVKQICYTNCFNEAKLGALTAEIINNSFTTSHCLYFTVDDCNFCSYYVWKAVEYLTVPIVVISNRKNNVDHIFCSGYIVTSSNFTWLSHLFSSHQYKQLSFRAQARILVVYSERRRFEEYKEFISNNLSGNDIILVEGFNDQLFLNRTLQVLSLRSRIYLGAWSKESHYKLTSEKFLFQPWRPRFDLNTFNVSLFHCPPFVYYSEEQGVYDGIDFKLLQEIGHKWPVRYNVYKEEEASPYRAVIVDVLERKSDLAVCSQWQFVLSGQPLEMSVPYTQHCITFLVPKPLILPASTYVYQAFSSGLWVTIVGSSLLVAAVLNQFSRAYVQINKTNFYAGFSYCVLQVVRIISLGSFHDFPSSSKNVFRIVLTVWCTCALILATSYSAGFATSLTYPKLSKPIKDLKDMVDENVVWGDKGVDSMQAFTNATSLILQGISRHYVVNMNTKEKNRRIRESQNYAVITKTLPDGYITETELLDDYAQKHLKILSECAQTYLIVFAFQRNSPFKAYFDEWILKYLEFGFVQHWYREVSYGHGLAKNMSDFYSSYVEMFDEGPLTLEKLTGAFYLFIVGMSASSLLFLLELRSKNNVA